MSGACSLTDGCEACAPHRLGRPWRRRPPLICSGPHSAIADTANAGGRASAAGCVATPYSTSWTTASTPVTYPSPFLRSPWAPHSRRVRSPQIWTSDQPERASAGSAGPPRPSPHRRAARAPVTSTAPISPPTRPRWLGREPLPTQNAHRDPATPQPCLWTADSAITRSGRPAHHAGRHVSRRRRCGKAADAAATIRRRQITPRYTLVHAQTVEPTPPGYLHEVDRRTQNSLLLLNNESIPCRFTQQCEKDHHL